MKKNIITAAGLISLIVLSYVGIAQLHSTRKMAHDEKGVEEEEMVEGKSAELVKLASGLQYRVLNHGTGDKTPTPGDTVQVHYTGFLSLDEKGEPAGVFDSSVSRGTPFATKIGVGHVIAGWDEALLSMRKGEKRLLIIPPQLAYGERGVPPRIPANATLMFIVELLDIIKS